MIVEAVNTFSLFLENKNAGRKNTFSFKEIKNLIKVDDDEEIK